MIDSKLQRVSGAVRAEVSAWWESFDPAEHRWFVIAGEGGICYVGAPAKENISTLHLRRRQPLTERLAEAVEQVVVEGRTIEVHYFGLHAPIDGYRHIWCWR